MNKQKPIHEIRYGFIRAAIWKNSGGFNVTFERLYKPDGAEKWKSTDSFGRDDLLVLAKVANEAHTKIFEQAD